MWQIGPHRIRPTPSISDKIFLGPIATLLKAGVSLIPYLPHSWMLLVGALLTGRDSSQGTTVRAGLPTCSSVGS